MNSSRWICIYNITSIKTHVIYSKLTALIMSWWCGVMLTLQRLMIEAGNISCMFSPLQFKAPSGVYKMSLTSSTHIYKHILLKQLTPPRNWQLPRTLLQCGHTKVIHKGSSLLLFSAYSWDSKANNSDFKNCKHYLLIGMLTPNVLYLQKAISFQIHVCQMEWWGHSPLLTFTTSNPKGFTARWTSNHSRSNFNPQSATPAPTLLKDCKTIIQWASYCNTEVLKNKYAQRKYIPEMAKDF